MRSVLGIDLGTSGVRIVILNEEGHLLYSAEKLYKTGINYAQDWEECCRNLILGIPSEISKTLKLCCVDGTSGTLVACEYDGNPIGEALPYYISCPEQKKLLLDLVTDQNLASTVNSSLARALRLTEKYGYNLILRHQADWISGWLLDDWRFGEAGNNLRLGWNLIEEKWPLDFYKLPWYDSLPKILKSGSILGKISSQKAKNLGLPKSLEIIAGTTDSNAAVLSTDATDKEGITVLGSTIVIKCFNSQPINYEGITNHFVSGKWICGGSSNAGGAVLKKFFNEEELKELSNQINPYKSSGLFYRPLPRTGERFPISDPDLEAILEPRPISDSLYLHGLLEGLARIEAEGWALFAKIGLSIPKQIITIGGGAGNPQWRKIRERIIGIPINSCDSPPAKGVAKIALGLLKSKNG